MECKTLYVSRTVRLVVGVLVETGTEHEMFERAQHYADQMIRVHLGKWDLQTILEEEVHISDDLTDMIHLCTSPNPIPVPHLPHDDLDYGGG